MYCRQGIGSGIMEKMLYLVVLCMVTLYTAHGHNVQMSLPSETIWTGHHGKGRRGGVWNKRQEMLSEVSGIQTIQLGMEDHFAFLLFERNFAIY